jgi:hypothetical protein
MRRVLAGLIVVVLAAPSMRAEANTWNKLRYLGGTVQAKVNPFDWNTTLTITADALVLAFGPKQSLRLKPDEVTALSYGQEAHRRVADMVMLSAVATPLALFGILHKSKSHLIGLEFRGADGKPGAILLEADKGHYLTILQMLKTVTGKQVLMAP